jgi:tripartite-type tricarboxylate transporter receptor subunit TctC
MLDGAMRVISRGVAETPMWRITHALVVVAALLAITPTYAQSAAEFYAGKQITLIVGASTGGGYDTQARLVARHLGKHIPGNPTIIVQNMPAAGSLAAANHITSLQRTVRSSRW